MINDSFSQPPLPPVLICLIISLNSLPRNDKISCLVLTKRKLINGAINLRTGWHTFSRGLAGRRRNSRKRHFILHIYSALRGLFNNARITSSSHIVAGRSQIQDEFQLSRHNNASHPCCINFLLKKKGTTPFLVRTHMAILCET